MNHPAPQVWEIPDAGIWAPIATTDADGHHEALQLVTAGRNHRVIAYAHVHLAYNATSGEYRVQVSRHWEWYLDVGCLAEEPEFSADAAEHTHADTLDEGQEQYRALVAAMMADSATWATPPETHGPRGFARWADTCREVA